MFNEILVLLHFTICSGLEGIFIILEGAGDIYYNGFVSILDHKVGSVWSRGTRDCLVGGDFSAVNGLLQVSYDFVMSLADGYHIGVAVTQNVGECFRLVGAVTTAACWIGWGPATLVGFGGKGICPCSVYKAPVAKADASSIIVPGEARSIVVFSDCTGNLSLVWFGTKFIGVHVLDMFMEERG